MNSEASHGSVPEQGDRVGRHEAIIEVERLHQFFQWWLGGTDVDPEEWGGFEAALDHEFEMVIPSGHTVDRDVLLTSFRPAFGAKPGLTIEIRNSKVFEIDASAVVVRYEEWQESPADRTARVSTALLKRSETAPAGWAWVTLQETWLPND